MGYQLPHPEAKPPELDENNVPVEFRHLIPLAEKYGVSDDGYRVQMLATLDCSERAELVQFLSDHDSALDSWLAGPEADRRSPTAEYIAFACLRMAADEVAAENGPCRVMVDKKSWTGLDEALTTGAKIRSTVVLLAMGLPMALLTYIIDNYVDGAWRQGCWVGLEMLWLFWAVGLVSVWWRPAWLWKLYLSVERKAVILAYAITYFIIASFFFAIVMLIVKR